MGIPYLLIALAVALLMDYAYPMHRGFMYLIHPVHLTYSLAIRLYSPYSGRAWGVVVWLLSTLPILIVYTAPIFVIPLGNALIIIIMLIYVGFVIKLSVSLRLLLNIARDYVKAVESGDLTSARGLAQQLVRRNVWVLDEPHVHSAVIESLFESLVDGFSSPLLYLVIMGPVGAMLQRLANTMDSALGYIDEPYRWVGWFSAKVDSLLNYVPARLTALLIILAGLLIGKRPNLSIYLRYRSVTRSINAGHPMAAASSVLGVALEKAGEYKIGEGKLPDHGDLLVSIKLAEVTTVLVILITATCLVAVSSAKLGLLGLLI